MNYIRAEALLGNTNLKITSKQIFQDNKYLQPVLEDDALLFSLDDLEPNTESSSIKESNLPNDEMVNLTRKTRRTFGAVKDRLHYLTNLKGRSSFQLEADSLRRFSDPGTALLSSVQQPAEIGLYDVRFNSDQTSLRTRTESTRSDADSHYKQAYAGIRRFRHISM